MPHGGGAYITTLAQGVMYTCSVVWVACLWGGGTGAGGASAARQVSGKVGGPLGSCGQPRLRALEHCAPAYCVIAAALHKNIFSFLKVYNLSKTCS